MTQTKMTQPHASITLNKKTLITIKISFRLINKLSDFIYWDYSDSPPPQKKKNANLKADLENNLSINPHVHIDRSDCNISLLCFPKCHGKSNRALQIHDLSPLITMEPKFTANLYLGDKICNLENCFRVLYQMQQKNHLDISYSLYPRSLHHQSKSLLKAIKYKVNYP